MILATLYAIVVGNLIALVVGAVEKSREPDLLAEALHSVGLRGGRLLVRLVVFVEIATVLAALFGSWVGVGALGLLDVAMVALLVVLHARKTNSSCGCFGARSAPISTQHIATNVVFAITALTVASIGAHARVSPHPSIAERRFDVIGYLLRSAHGFDWVVWTVTIIGSGIGCLLLLTKSFAVIDGAAPNAPQLRLPDGSPFAKSAIDIHGVDLHSGASIEVVASEATRTMLAFLSSNCLTCRGYWELLRDEHPVGLPPDARLVVVARDAAVEDVPMLRALAGPNLGVVLSSAAWSDYDVPGSPFFVLLASAQK